MPYYELEINNTTADIRELLEQSGASEDELGFINVVKRDCFNLLVFEKDPVDSEKRRGILLFPFSINHDDNQFESAKLVILQGFKTERLDDLLSNLNTFDIVKQRILATVNTAMIAVVDAKSGLSIIDLDTKSQIQQLAEVTTFTDKLTSQIRSSPVMTG